MANEFDPKMAAAVKEMIESSPHFELLKDMSTKTAKDIIELLGRNLSVLDDVPHALAMSAVLSGLTTAWVLYNASHVCNLAPHDSQEPDRIRMAEVVMSGLSMKFIEECKANHFKNAANRLVTH